MSVRENKYIHTAFLLIYEVAFIPALHANLNFPNWEIHFTLCEEHRVDFDASSVSQPVRQLGEVETLKVEANLKILTIALHLV